MKGRCEFISLASFPGRHREMRTEFIVAMIRKSVKPVVTHPGSRHDSTSITNPFPRSPAPLQHSAYVAHDVLSLVSWSKARVCCQDLESLQSSPHTNCSLFEKRKCFFLVFFVSEIFTRSDVDIYKVDPQTCEHPQRCLLFESKNTF